MTTIDVNLQKDMVQALSGIPIGNDCYTFFYDETGNCRKFYLKDATIILLNPMKIDIFKFRICLSDFLESYFCF